MKKLILFIVLVLVVFLAINRNRVFLRDPLATVTRDGVKVGDVKVMINYPNDVLLDDQSTANHRLYIVQNWNRKAEFVGAPLKCLYGTACMTDADQASGTAVPPGSRGRRSAFEGVTMTNKRVEFVDEDGALVVVTLR